MKPTLNLHHFFSSLQFLTIIPIRKNLQIDEVALGKSGTFFPLVGFIIGLILLIVSKFFLTFFPMSISDLLVLTVLVILTGAIHLDGFCDTMDALASRSNPEETLRIMRDSRLGAIGAICLFFLLLLKYSALNNLVPDSKNSMLILMPTLGRYSIAQLAFFSSYARTGPGKGRPFTEYIETKEILIALGQTILISLAVLGLSGIIFILLISLFTFGWGFYVNRRIGGVTGDILGAICEMNEVLVLLLGLMLA
jgi:adenosylcobinamide-GDP ribazoletransferase